MNQTQYGYDAMDRLVSITYPDASTEGFSYDVAGNLHTYTNNRSQSRTFGYDNANRLLSMLYNTDSTQVSWTYDNVSNVLTRTERNGDVVAFSYDLLYRVTGVIRTPSGSGAASWMQTSSYDANSNRTQLDTRLLAPPEPEYGGAEYGAAVYLVPGASWTVPSGGYDAMNRLVAFQDVAGAQATLAYDVEGQRTSLAFAGGGGPLTSTYDAVNRVVGMAAPGANTTFSYATGYDLASQRTFVTVNGDHGDYQMDAKGQLVVETCNRFVETGYGAFQNGAFSAVTVDPASGNLSLVAFNDAFSGNTLNLDRWRLTMADGRYVGLAIRQEAELQFVFPFWGTNLVTSALPPVYEGVGLLSTAMYGAAEHRLALSGDFDVQVSYDHWQGLNGSQAVWAGLMVSDLPVEGTVLSPANMAFVGREHLSSGADQYIANVYVAGTLATTAPATTTDTLGRLRIKRSSSTVTLYYWNNGTSSWVLLATNTTFSMATMCVSHYFYVGPGGLATIGFTNFQVNSGNAYPSTGTYTSQVYDAGSSVAWTGLTWAASVPSGASLEFQVGVSNSPTGPFTYVGPDGTSSTYFTTSGGSFPSLTGRYASYQATFGYPGTGSSPTLSRVDLSYGGTNASTAILNQFDSVGNIIGREVDTGGNVTTETRTLNDLNQITGITVMAGGSTTAVWDLTYDLSGNLLTKTNTTTSETTTFNWDEDNRLTSVVLPGNITIDMGYDVLGRMISRTDSTGTTYFAWDGMDCIQELAPSGELTNYYMPEGVLLSFDRFRPEPRPVYGMGKYGTDLYWHRSVYNVMTDGLGSVRQVRDTNGVLVAQYDTDAWGNLLPSSFDSVPNGGCMYRYVGAAGVRWDSATGLYYMRQRWYDPTLQRFIGRDPLRNGNLYSYCRNNPATLVDPDGTVPRPYAIGPGPHDSPPVTANVLGGGVQPIGDPNTSGDNSNAFLKFLQGVRPCSISKLTIHGHGAKFSAGLDPSDANSPDRMIYFPPSGQRPAALGLTGPNIPDTDISSLLRRDMMPGGQILINDCHCGDETGAPGDVNFAKGLASQVPGVYVTGVQGDYYLRPDGMTTYAGGYHTYFYPGPPAPPSQP
jgi:RHS repeat-associated protein